MSKQIEVGYGYRRLGKEEILRDGDEFNWDGKWKKTGNPGVSVACQYPAHYRRAIEPGAGYKLVPVGTAIQHGDQRLNHRGEWKLRMHTIGSTVQHDDDPTRRAIEAPKQPVSPVPKPGNGYRLLGDDETIQLGDEYYCPVALRWESAGSIGWTPGKSVMKLKYRRKKSAPEKAKIIAVIDPGTGYRLLARGEILELGDEYLSSSDEWIPTGDPGRVFGSDCTLRAYRRKVSPAPKKYRLLSVGEIICEGDEVWVVDSRGCNGHWTGGIAGGVIQKGANPFRREITNIEYTGGPA